MVKKDKQVTFTWNDFAEISTDAAAEICRHFDGDPKLMMFSALLCADIARRLFGTDELVVEEKGE